VIPPNINYRLPNIQNEQIKVVEERTRLNGDYCSVNSFGLGGANVHTIFGNCLFHGPLVSFKRK
jgi:3-oxoacyl-(acyl-carrier-protein) synthase